MSGKYGEPWEAQEAHHVATDGDWRDLWGADATAIGGAMEAMYADRAVECVNACEGVEFTGDPQGAVRELYMEVWEYLQYGASEEIPRLEAALARFQIENES